MPAKNLEKTYIEDGHYHIYSRGVNKEKIYRDDRDYKMFLSLFKRYLDKEPISDSKGREYPWYREDIELLAYCLMPNHFHAFVYQHQADAITQLFKSVLTAYSMYFNKRYDRQGPVFQSRFKASLIQDDSYYLHISRYIHRNPRDYRNYTYSSYKYYLQEKSASWLRPELVLSNFASKDEYEEFVDDYQDYKETLKDLQQELAK